MRGPERVYFLAHSVEPRLVFERYDRVALFQEGLRESALVGRKEFIGQGSLRPERIELLPYLLPHSLVITSFPRTRFVLCPDT